MTVLESIDTVILHAPKTGGSSVRWPAINKFNIRYACQHCNYKMLPEEYKNFRKITFVRHPLAWYKSRYYFDLYNFSKARGSRDIMTTALSHVYTKSFNETLDSYLNPDEAFKDPKTIDIFRKLTKLDALRNYTCWNISYQDNINKVEPGFFNGQTYYQWLLNITGIQYADVAYRLEDQYALGMKKEFGEDINLVHKNKTKQKNIIDYSDENKKIVLEREQDFIKKYEY